MKEPVIRALILTAFAACFYFPCIGVLMALNFVRYGHYYKNTDNNQKENNNEPAYKTKRINPASTV